MFSLPRKILLQVFGGSFLIFVVVSCVPGVDSQGKNEGPAFQSSGGSSSDFSSPGESSKPSVFMSFDETTANPTNSSAFSFIITFSDTVEDFSKWDIDISNGRVSDFIAGGDVYFVDVEAFGHGAVDVDVKDGALKSRSITNNLPIDHTLTNDLEGPEGTFSDPSGTPTTLDTTVVSLDFDEDVTGLTAPDFTVTNGNVRNVFGAGDSYLIEVQPLSVGAVSVTLNASSVQDSVGNNNTTTPNVSFTATDDPNDTLSPYLTLTSAESSPTTSDPIPYTATFTEDVTGFSEGDIQVTNGSVSGGSLSGGPDTYTFDVTPSSQGDVTVSIPSDVVEDDAGNGNLPDSLELFYDESSITATLALQDIENGSTVNSVQSEVKLTFSENVRGVESSDFTVTNGTLKNLRGSQDEYFFDLEADSAGGVDVTFDAMSVEDTNGNGNQNAASSNTVGWTYDNSQPTLTLATTATDPTFTSPIPMTATFDENVTGFSAADVSVINGRVDVSSFSGSGSNYSFDVVPSIFSGMITISVVSGAAEDSLGNPSTADSLINGYDENGPPEATLSWDSSVKTFEATSPMRVYIQFDESVTGLTKGDFDSTNIDMTASTLLGSEFLYALDVVPASQGPLDLFLTANSVQDSFGNDNPDPSNTINGNFQKTFLTHLGSVTAPNDGGGNDFFMDTVVDSSGDVYACGYTTGDLVNANSGGSDAVVIKMSSNGSLLWERQLGTTAADRFMGAAIDSSDNVICAGLTKGDFGETNSGPSEDVIVVKFNSAGTEQWRTHLGQTTADNDNTGYERCTDVDVDGSDNIYCTGHTNGDFGSFDGTPESADDGSRDAFVLKLDSSGALQWVTQFGSESESSPMVNETGEESPKGIKVANSGDVFVTGATAENLVESNPSGESDIFTMKLDSAGALQWLTHLGSSTAPSGSWGQDFCMDIDLDSSGNVYCAGFTSDGFDGNNAGLYDSLVAKFDPSGNFQWISQLGSQKVADNPALNNANSKDLAHSMAIDGSDNIYFAGETGSNYGEENAGKYDIFVAKMNTDGELGWLTHHGSNLSLNDSSEDETCRGLATDDSGGIFCAGQTASDLDEDSGGFRDAFIWKITESGDYQ